MLSFFAPSVSAFIPKMTSGFVSTPRSIASDLKRIRKRLRERGAQWRRVERGWEWRGVERRGVERSGEERRGAQRRRGAESRGEERRGEEYVGSPSIKLAGSEALQIINQIKPWKNMNSLPGRYFWPWGEAIDCWIIHRLDLEKEIKRESYMGSLPNIFGDLIDKQYFHSLISLSCILLSLPVIIWATLSLRGRQDWTRFHERIEPLTCGDAISFVVCFAAIAACIRSVSNLDWDRFSNSITKTPLISPAALASSDKRRLCN